MTYEYTCRPCLVTFDVVKPLSECDREELCFSCGKTVERVISLSALEFRGGGWSSDGYSKK